MKKKMGRPYATDLGRPMTAAERMRRSREMRKAATDNVNPQPGKQGATGGPSKPK